MKIKNQDLDLDVDTGVHHMQTFLGCVVGMFRLQVRAWCNLHHLVLLSCSENHLNLGRCGSIEDVHLAGWARNVLYIMTSRHCC